MTPVEELGDLAGVPLEVEAVLDRRVFTVSDILELKPGSVIRMDRSAGENIDLYVGGSHVAFGEVVVMENMMCVRVTDFRDRE
ncbi:MAG: FliM/FliN family flagellar motor switch protein [Bryobacteraceae bacterium]|jgi:flagellar motor switch protein FliN/FliY